MKRLQPQLGCIAALLLASISAEIHAMSNETPSEPPMETAVLFEDPMTANWQDNWFLDGERATLEHRDGGLAFLTTASEVDKRVGRAAFDAQHAVLWTRQEFAGDIRITYTYSKLPECSWQKLIYVQARGTGHGPYVQDIYAWRELRRVAVMSEYFNRMDLISLSVRDEIRCKRYPLSDPEGNKLEPEFLPRASYDGIAIGRDVRCQVDKRSESIRLLMTYVDTGERILDHTWDLTDERVNQGRDPEFVEVGRIGIRLMGGHKILMRDFTLERL